MISSQLFMKAILCSVFILNKVACHKRSAGSKSNVSKIDLLSFVTTVRGDVGQELERSSEEQ